jgi:hypothetical protein
VFPVLEIQKTKSYDPTPVASVLTERNGWARRSDEETGPRSRVRVVGADTTLSVKPAHRP